MPAFRRQHPTGEITLHLSAHFLRLLISFKKEKGIRITKYHNERLGFKAEDLIIGT